MKNIREWKFESKVNGGIDYLYVDSDKKEYSSNFYKFNGGHRDCEMVKQKEVKRLTEYYRNIMEYKEV